MREASLVFFTLAAQTSAGAYMILAVFQLFGPDELLRLPVIAAIGILLGFALLGAFFHLGNPGQAFRALSNLRSSWLSREILAVSAFGCLLLTNGGLSLTDVQPPRLLPLLVSISAFALVIVMGRAYLLPALPAWNSPVTVLSFFAASVLLGGGFAAILLLSFSAEDWTNYALPITVIMETALLVELGAAAWRYRSAVPRRSGNLRRAGDIHRPGEVSAVLRNIHLGLLAFAGVLLGVCHALQFAHDWWLGLAFILTLFGQVAGRVAFYQVGLGNR